MTDDSLKCLFDRVVAVNLDRRTDRWLRFQTALRCARWPFGPVARVSAVDGQATGCPPWWSQGRGAWGCMMSHARVLESALADGVESLLVLEDDATFLPRFSLYAAQFVRHLPDDWDGLMLGGQHLQAPISVNDYVCRVTNGNRTHAYAARGEFIRTLYAQILDAPGYLSNPRHHVDHRMGALHATGKHHVYAPTQWIVGQGATRSDVGRDSGERYWLDTRTYPKTPHVGGDVCLFSTYLNPSPATELVREYAKRTDRTFDLFVGWHSWQNTGKRVAAIRRAQLVLIWGGQEPGNDWTVHVARRYGVPVLYLGWSAILEGGIHVDRAGDSDRSLLCGDLSWVTPDDLERLRSLRSKCAAPKGPDADPFILVPLQSDRQAVLHFDARWRRIADFVRWVESEFPDREIVLSPDVEYPDEDVLSGRSHLDSERSFRELAMAAERVVGINSPRLLQAAFLGRPAAAHGACPMKVHEDGDARDRLLAATLAQECALDADAFNRVIERALDRLE